MTARQGLRWWLLILSSTRAVCVPVAIALVGWTGFVSGWIRADFFVLFTALACASAAVVWSAWLTVAVRRWMTRRGWRLR